MGKNILCLSYQWHMYSGAMHKFEFDPSGMDVKILVEIPKIFGSNTGVV